MPTTIEHVCELYYRTESIRFDEQGEGFSLSAHLENPDLPKSPYYLHYPKPDEPGYQYMPYLIQFIGLAFLDKIKTLGIEGHKIAAVPEGADPLAKETARLLPGYPDNLLRFAKISKNDKTDFEFVDGLYLTGDELAMIDDHTSGGRNKRLLQKAALKVGLEPTHVLTVVDREQGAVQALQDNGLIMASLVTITEVFEYGVLEGHITSDMFEVAHEYVQANPIPTNL